MGSQHVVMFECGVLPFVRLSELQQSHVAELTRLRHAHSSELSSVQQALQEERKRREEAEKSLEGQGDVSISMEDVQPFVSVGGGAGGETGPATLGKGVG